MTANPLLTWEIDQNRSGHPIKIDQIDQDIYGRSLNVKPSFAVNIEKVYIYDDIY
jgi:hypothetical protein